jgi:hypothetical protein
MADTNAGTPGSGQSVGGYLLSLVLSGALVFGIYRVIGHVSAPSYEDMAVRMLAERNGVFKDQITDLKTEFSGKRGAVIQATIRIDRETDYALLLFTKKDGETIDSTYWIMTRAARRYSDAECLAFAKSVGITE